MSDEIKVVGGVLLIIGFVFYMLAAPALVEATRTTSGSQLENATTTIKTLYNVMGNFLGIFPYIFMLLGLGLIWKG